jgi:methylase of polypeptide subunit release factors
VDLIVSNPPYLPTDLLPGLPPEVSGHEPALALDGGHDGMTVIRRLIESAPRGSDLRRAGARNRRRPAGPSGRDP